MISSDRTESPHHLIDRSISFFDGSSYELVSPSYPNTYIHTRIHKVLPMHTENRQHITFSHQSPPLRSTAQSFSSTVPPTNWYVHPSTYIAINTQTCTHTVSPMYKKTAQGITSNDRIESPPCQPTRDLDLFLWRIFLRVGTFTVFPIDLCTHIHAYIQYHFQQSNRIAALPTDRLIAFVFVRAGTLTFPPIYL